MGWECDPNTFCQGNGKMHGLVKTETLQMLGKHEIKYLMHSNRGFKTSLNFNYY